ncbi:Molybdenum cofactor sulfurase [Linum perenne]
MVSNVEEVIVAEESKKTHSVIPAHLVAEAISTLRGLDLRWSGPITPTEMEYVKQYVLAKYPQYSNGIVEDGAAADNLEQPPSKTSSPQNSTSSTPSFSRSFSDLDRTQLEHSRLLDILTKKTSFQGNFMSIPEIQGRNRALRHCGLSENDYLVIFMPSYKDALTMVGESYPFFKGNYYMTIVGEKLDGGVRTMAAGKEAKVVPMPESWLDLRIKGSQLSQYFRRKCKSVPKGLFAYPAELNGIRYSMHWISEAHRNSWHVLLDATGVVLGEERMNLALHRPDFVVCGMENNGGSGHGFVDNGGQQMVSNIACLLVRKDSFDTS